MSCSHTLFVISISNNIYIKKAASPKLDFPSLSIYQGTQRKKRARALEGGAGRLMTIE